MGFSKLESILGDRIEGFFNKCFSGTLELAEIMKQLEREMIRKKKRSDDGYLVPNAYTVFLSEEDYGRLCAQRFQDELHEALEKQVILQDCFMDGVLQLHLQKSKLLKEGLCEIQSSFAGELEENEEEQHTLVLERKKFNVPLNLPYEYKTASLTVLDGIDKDSYLEFGEKQIYLGRLDKNDFILLDTNVSRMHAYITYERHRHVLHDADSLNGTFVNDEKVKSVCLRAGDEIKIGHTVLLYEVI